MASSKLVAFSVAGAAVSNQLRRTNARSADGNYLSGLSRPLRPDTPRSAGPGQAEAPVTGRPATAPGSRHLTMLHAPATLPSVQSSSGDGGREEFLSRLKSLRSGRTENSGRDMKSARPSTWDEAPRDPTASGDAGDYEVAILSPHQFEAEAAARAATATQSRNLARCDAPWDWGPHSLITQSTLPIHDAFTTALLLSPSFQAL